MEPNRSREVSKQLIEKKGVYVFVRVRPPLNYEIKKGGHRRCVEVGKDLKSITVKLKQKETYHDFQYDHVFDEDTTQRELYEQTVKCMIPDLCNGYNASVLCYGQTSSGKTYTMFGPGFEFKKNNDLKFHNKIRANQKYWGIIPRLVSDIFSECSNFDPSITETKISTSFIEIYKEDVRDLLEPSKTNLKIRFNPKGLSVPSATVVPVQCFLEVMAVMKRGLRNRFVAETNCNRESSRSHAVMIISISTHNYVDQVTKLSQLYLVDLAGSEKVSKTKAEGERLQEACNINFSLLALRQVIAKLTSNKGGQHIPYRDSQLTFLLQNSFGGNAISVLMMNVSPHMWNRTETVSTLRFGERSLRIKNNPRQNKKRTVAQLERLLSKAEAEIGRLRNMNTKLRSMCRLKNSNGIFQSGDGFSDGPFPSGGSEEQFQQQQQQPNFPFGEGKMIDLSSFHSFFICPLSRKFMKNPVICLDGITYEKNAILKYMNNPRKRMISPITKNRIVSKLLIPNITVEAQIKYFKENYPEAFEGIDYSDFDFIGYSKFIPDEILVLIFSFVNEDTLIRCGNVNSQWNSLARKNILWKSLYFNSYGVEERLVVDWKEYFWNRRRGGLQKGSLVLHCAWKGVVFV